MDEQGGAAGAGGAEREPVPYSRFQEVVGKKNAAEARIAELEASIQSAIEKSATADTLAKTINDLKTAHKSELAQMQEALGLSRAGLHDPAGVAIARTLYGLEPEDKRPKSLPEYVQQFLGDGDDVPEPPPGLAPYLGLSKKKAPEANGRTSDLEQLRAYGSPRRRQGSAPGAPDVTAAAIRDAKAQFARQPTEENAAALKRLLRGA